MIGESGIKQNCDVKQQLKRGLGLLWGGVRWEDRALPEWRGIWILPAKIHALILIATSRNNCAIHYDSRITKINMYTRGLEYSWGLNTEHRNTKLFEVQISICCFWNGRS